MYLGRIVEVADRETLYRDPRHPYTEALMSAIPVPEPALRRRRIILMGDVPSPLNPPSGCRFHPRCWLREQLGNPQICETQDPPLRPFDDDHIVACHFAEQAGRRDRAAIAASEVIPPPEQITVPAETPAATPPPA
jgi:oligopeptide/dipeptide ABC transporter ATP-binding protein